MKRVLLTIAIIVLPVLSQAQITDTLELTGFPVDVSLDDARGEILKGSINRAVLLYKAVLMQKQEKRTFQKGVGGELLGEYAYALALSHNFDYALVNIDRARQLGGDHLNFYTAQVLKLMRMDTLAQKFEYSFAPSWVFEQHTNLTTNNAIPVRKRAALDRKMLQTAYELSRKQQYIQALVILYQLEEDYPNAYIIPSISSQVWEKIGNFDMAATRLKQAIKLMELTDNEKDKQNYADLLAELEAKKVNKHNTSNKQTGTLSYIGLSFTNERLSYEGRYGMYEKYEGYRLNRISRSLNYSYTFMIGQEITTYSLGYSKYRTIGNFVWGWGYILTTFKMNNNYSFSYSGSLSTGLTFPNKTQSSSFDIMFNLNLSRPLFVEGSKSSFSYTISMGQTFYF